MKVEVKGNRQNTQELLPQIVERIFLICKTDPNFKLKDDLENVENEIDEIKEKISKQDILLQKSDEIKKEFLQRISILEDENKRKQMSLLESIGGEL